jgi:hypothetical protein
MWLGYMAENPVFNVFTPYEMNGDVVAKAAARNLGIDSL